ncbi:uncharacterized protein METZ01_LOCUS75246 [marine metagenome]|uniref:DNA (cytosine-5-)-methyltransferase n=1 Tax=marine metagenome TaxID=408172 RepID=A0A381U2D3_9ZZZZ
MKFFDLFAGIGGFRLGMERNGHECIGSCEIDQYARQIYARNFGHEPEYKDATKLNPKELPDFQCLCAGFPCQSFSLAGQRGGFEDTRGTLFFEIIRIIREKQPSVLFLENVKGLLSHDKGKTYRTILTTLDEVGYDTSFQLINSKYFLPQNRDRIFIIGHLRGKSRREILPLGEISEGDDRTPKNGNKIELEAKHINMTKHNGSRVYSKDGIAPSVMAGEGSGTRIKIAEPKTGLYAIGSTQKHTAVMKDLSPTLTEAMGKGGGHVPMVTRIKIAEPKSIQRCGDRDKKTYSIKDISHCLNANPMSDYQNKIIEPKIKQIGKIHKGQSGVVYSIDGIATTICGCGGGSGAKTGLYAEPKLKKVGIIGKGGQGMRVYSIDGIASNLNALSGGMGAKTGLYLDRNDMNIPKPDDISRTVRVGGRGSTDRHSWDIIDDNTRVRRLTPTECERLQGFPDGYTIGISETQRYKCLGNAVTVNTIQYIASFF